MQDKNRGFTLIELLVVVTILAILAVAGFASYSGIAGRARDSRRKSDLAQIKKALEMYRTDVGTYPASITSGNAIFGPSTTYMRSVPLDPAVGTTYNLSGVNGGTSFSIVCTQETGGATPTFTLTND